MARSLTNSSACRTGGAAAKLNKSSGDWSSPGLAAPVDDSAPRSASAYNNNAHKRFIWFPQLCASKIRWAIGHIYLGRVSKTQSGVRIQELAIGNGLEATRGDSVEFDYVLRSACCASPLHNNHSVRCPCSSTAIMPAAVRDITHLENCRHRH